MAGFAPSTFGRFWVSTEAYTPPETKSGSPRRTGTPRFDWWAVTDSNRGPAD